ncbi:XIAP-associated factor 1 [Hippoglossus hippoglossus]|uniref:XIAP-associated factor 1 n=1 Tax=Hippoglossus hippoglossus TaxID=8267 RepID=UPI00148BF40F|nr:XIAP-associated factor 1 [Hippoglossus hippoglossus]
MDNTNGTRTCGLCHKEVAEANFALHETHCSRFLCLCPDCDEAVPKEQLSQHREEEHTPTRCSKCHQKMERCRLKDHESDECVERLQACQFCDLELPWKQLEEHCLVCGSRTELCRDCSRYVRLRDQPEHASTCPAAGNDASPPQTASIPTNEITITCSGCMGFVSAEDIEKHELECFSASGWDYSGKEKKEHEKEEREHEEDKEEEEELPGQVTTPQLSSIYKAASLSNTHHSGPLGEGDQDQISICPHCHLALPLFTLRRHQAKCQIYIQLK